MPAVILPRKSVEWAPIREAYVQRAPKPTWEELETEFSVAIPTLQRCSNEEGWATLRTKFLENQLSKADASEVLLEACKLDRTMIRSVCDLALVALDRIKAAVVALDDKPRSPTTRLTALNTAGFATAQFCRALKDLGIVGLPGGLANAGREENNRWNPQMLSQINLTVQNLVAQADGKPTPAPPAPVDVPKATDETP